MTDVERNEISEDVGRKIAEAEFRGELPQTTLVINLETYNAYKAHLRRLYPNRREWRKHMKQRWT